MYRYTYPHCNTAQHTALHCSALHSIRARGDHDSYASPADAHFSRYVLYAYLCIYIRTCTATRCNTLQHTAAYCTRFMREETVIRMRRLKILFFQEVRLYIYIYIHICIHECTYIYTHICTFTTFLDCLFLVDMF